MTSQPAPRIFISYSRKDGDTFAAGLRRELEGLGFTIWQDLIALKSGPHWWSQIEDALRSKQLEHFVLVLTPGALDSSVVRREIRLARQEGKTVSVVRGPGIPDDFHVRLHCRGDVDVSEPRVQGANFLQGDQGLRHFLGTLLDHHQIVDGLPFHRPALREQVAQTLLGNRIHLEP